MTVLCLHSTIGFLGRKLERSWYAKVLIKATGEYNSSFSFFFFQKNSFSKVPDMNNWNLNCRKLRISLTLLQDFSNPYDSPNQAAINSTVLLLNRHCGISIAFMTWKIRTQCPPLNTPRFRMTTWEHNLEIHFYLDFSMRGIWGT